MCRRGKWNVQGILVQVPADCVNIRKTCITPLGSYSVRYSGASFLIFFFYECPKAPSSIDGSVGLYLVTIINTLI